MTDYRWIRVTTCDNIPPREGRAVRLGARELAIFNLGHQFVAIDNQCPHQQGPLADGIVAGAAVVCPLHAWRIDLTSGRIERPAATAVPAVRTYPVRVEHGIVLAGLPLDEPDRPIRSCASVCAADADTPVANSVHAGDRGAAVQSA